jgi:hypothetical protein
MLAPARSAARLEIAAMSIRRALVLFAALFIGLNPANADNIKFKYLLQCGGAKSVPPDNDPDPIVWTRIVAIEGGEIYIRHFAAGGENYTRNEQYRDLKFWSEGKTDNWSGTSIKHPNRTLVGRLQMDKTDRWVEYVEKLYSGGKLQSTTTSACRYISPDDVGGKSYSPDNVGGESHLQRLERCIWELKAECPD